MSTFSAIRMLGGVPTLFVNGEPQAGLAYMTYLTERADYANMAAMGCRLYSVCAFFAARPVNAAEQCRPFSPGIFDTKGSPDYSAVDADIEQLLRICPDAFIFPRVNVTLPRWWEEEHPGECNDSGINGKPPRACLAGECWRRDTADLLEAFIRHMETAPYADRILGYQIAGGQTEEWMAFDMNGNRCPALRAAFEKACPGGSEAAYRQFSSTAAADAIALLSRRAKAVLNGSKVVGAFYGYTFETPWWQSAHGAMSQLLREDSVDFLCSPLSYNRLRAPGIDWACMTVLDSIRLHGKLYFAEADVRTCQTLSLAESRPGICAPADYAGGIWAGPQDPWLCRQLLRKVFARALCAGHALWWFDMWGGWYDHPDLQAELASYFAPAAQSLHDADRTAAARLAVFADEKAPAEADVPMGQAPGCAVLSQSRIPLGACGAPYAVFELADFDAVLQMKNADGTPEYAAAVFLIHTPTAAMQNAIAAWQAANRPQLTVTAEAPLSAGDVHMLCLEAGIHTYAAPGDVIYAAAGWLAIHAAEAGEKLLRLPASRRITPVLADEGVCMEPFEADSIPLTLKQYETRVFRLDTL